MLTTVWIVASPMLGQTNQMITPEARIAADELHELGMQEWYQANFERAELLLLRAAKVAPSGANLHDVAGIYFAQRKFDLADVYLAQAKSVILAESGARSQDYAEVLALEAELYQKLGRADEAIATAQGAGELLLALIKNPSAEMPFARERALHAYVQLSEIHALAQIDAGQPEAAEARLRNLQSFVDGIDFAIPYTVDYDLALAKAIEAQGRGAEAVEVLGGIDSYELLRSPVIADNQTGVEVIKTMTEALDACDDQARLDEYLMAVRADLDEIAREGGDLNVRMLERIEEILAQVE